MEKNYLVAYISGEEENIKKALSEKGIITGKTPHAHAFTYTTKIAKSEIDAIPGVLYVEEAK